MKLTNLLLASLLLTSQAYGVLSQNGKSTADASKMQAETKYQFKPKPICAKIKTQKACVNRRECDWANRKCNAIKMCEEVEGTCQTTQFYMNECDGETLNQCNLKTGKESCVASPDCTWGKYMGNDIDSCYQKDACTAAKCLSTLSTSMVCGFSQQGECMASDPSLQAQLESVTEAQCGAPCQKLDKYAACTSKNRPECVWTGSVRRGKCTYSATSRPTRTPTTASQGIVCSEIEKKACFKNKNKCTWDPKKSTCSAKTSAPTSAPTVFTCGVLTPTKTTASRRTWVKSGRKKCENTDGCYAGKYECLEGTRPTAAPTVFTCSLLSGNAKTKAGRSAWLRFGKKKCDAVKGCYGVDYECVEGTPPTKAPTVFTCGLLTPGKSTMARRTWVKSNRKKCEENPDCYAGIYECLEGTRPTAAPTVFTCDQLSQKKGMAGLREWNAKGKKLCEQAEGCYPLKNKCLEGVAPTAAPTEFTCGQFTPKKTTMSRRAWVAKGRKACEESPDCYAGIYECLEGSRPTAAPTVFTCGQFTPKKTTASRRIWIKSGRKKCDESENCYAGKYECLEGTRPTAAPTVFTCDQLSQKKGMAGLRAWNTKGKKMCEETEGCYPLKNKCLEGVAPTAAPTAFSCSVLTPKRTTAARKAWVKSGKQACIDAGCVTGYYFCRDFKCGDLTAKTKKAKQAWDDNSEARQDCESNEACEISTKNPYACIAKKESSTIDEQAGKTNSNSNPTKGGK